MAAPLARPPATDSEHSRETNMSARATTTVHTMTRLDIATAMSFNDFREAFEHAAPIFDAAAVHKIAARGGSWDEVRSAVASNAPNGLMIFASIDATPLMSAAGHHTQAVEYLLGNNVVAETMFRHDPKALLYVPLRVLVHADANDDAIFSLDQPSTALASLGCAAITDVGRELDHKVAALLAVIGVDAQESFATRN
jgi:uncharacterized protein (DUF302 family)